MNQPAFVHAGPAPRVGEIVECALDERELVAWRTASGRLCVTDARCPHEWTHLASSGVVDGEELVCTAHFWRFAADGSAAVEAERGQREPRCGIDVVACDERDGHVWVAPR